MGLVEYAGTVHPGRGGAARDPAGTLRVERARLLRLDVRHMPPDRGSAAAAPLRRRYGVPVVDHDLNELHGAPLWRCLMKTKVLRSSRLVQAAFPREQVSALAATRGVHW